MAAEVLTRCGYRCDLCHAYKDNIEKDDQRQMLSDGWFKLFGFRIVPENIYCEGCISSNCLTANLIDKGCPVRPCVIEKGYENCAQCDKFICEKLKERIVIFEDREEKVGFKISRSERKHIIKPYENFVRLSELKEANALHSRMLNKLIIPTDDTMKKFIESEDIVRSWDEIHDYINNVYVLDRKLSFGGKKYGWCIGYKKGKKTITTLFPERKGFTILFTFGRSENEEYENRKGEVSDETRELIASTDQLHDGRWIWLRIRNESQIDDVKTLLEIKRKPIR
jgi:hypothetical protein